MADVPMRYSDGWKCCCCDLPVLRPAGTCPKQNPEKYAIEAAAILLAMSEQLRRLAFEIDARLALEFRHLWPLDEKVRRIVAECFRKEMGG